MTDTSGNHLRTRSHEARSGNIGDTRLATLEALVSNQVPSPLLHQQLVVMNTSLTALSGSVAAISPAIQAAVGGEAIAKAVGQLERVRENNELAEKVMNIKVPGFDITVPGTVLDGKVVAYVQAFGKIPGMRLTSARDLRIVFTRAFGHIGVDTIKFLTDLADTDFTFDRFGVVPAFRKLLVQLGFTLLAWRHYPQPTKQSTVMEYNALLEVFASLSNPTGDAAVPLIAQAIHQFLHAPSPLSSVGRQLADITTRVELNKWLTEQQRSAIVHPKGGSGGGGKGKGKEAQKKSEDADAEYVLSLHRSAPSNDCTLAVVVYGEGGRQMSTRAAVDTQADVDAISASLASRLNLKLYRRRRPLLGATSSMQSSTSHTASFRMQVDDGEVAISSATVVTGLRFDLIIGKPGIKQLGIVITPLANNKFDLKPTLIPKPTSSAPPSAPSLALPPSTTMLAPSPSPTLIAAISTMPVPAPIASSSPTPTPAPAPAATPPPPSTPPRTYKYATAVDEAMVGVDTSEMTPEQIEKVRAQLTRLHQHGLLLGKNSPGPTYPKANDAEPFELSVKEGGDLSKAYCQWRHFPPETFNTIRTHVDQLVADNILVPATGYSPTQMIPYAVDTRDPSGKVSGKRVIVDSRRLNEQTVRMQHQMPNITEMLQWASEGVYTSVVDCAKFYNQFQVTEATGKLLRIRVGDKLYDAKRIIPGIHSAPAVAQAYMDAVMVNDKRKAFQDDIAGKHKTVDEAIEWVTDLVDTGIKHNITFNATKFRLCRRVNTILGFQVSHRAIEPIPSRVQLFIDEPTPATKKGLERWLARARWYHRHIPNLSQHAAILNELLKPHVKFEWQAQHQAAFEAIQKALLNCAVLSAPLTDVPVYISTDASDLAVGVVVEQFVDGVPYILLVDGTKLNSSQQNYTIHEKELYALKFALDKYGAWLREISNDLHWRTDSQTAASFRTMKLDGKSPAMREFALSMQDVPLTIHLISSIDNPVADEVSRARQFHTPTTIAALGDSNNDDDDDDNNDDDDDNDDDDSADNSTAQSSTSTDNATPSHTHPSSRESSPPPPPPTDQHSRSPPPLPPDDVPRGEPEQAVPTAAPIVPTPTTAPTAAPIPTPSAAELFIELSKPINDSELAALVSAQQADSSLDIYRDAAAGKIVPALVHDLRVCIDSNGLLMVRDPLDTARTRVIVPSSLRNKFCQYAHSGIDGGHHGPKSSVALSREYAWWPSQEDDVATTARRCLHCQSTKTVPTNSEMGRPPTTCRRFERLFIDYVPMPNVQNNAGFYVIADAATGYAWSHIVPDKTAASACSGDALVPGHIRQPDLSACRWWQRAQLGGDEGARAATRIHARDRITVQSSIERHR